MNISTRIAVIAMFAACMCTASATDSRKPEEATRLRLVEGSNDVSAGGVTVRVIKASVSMLTAHSYETYTSFVLPSAPAGAWQQILVDQPDQDFPDFRTVESADSTVQAIALYRDRDTLYVIQATKEGLSPPDLYLKPAHVTFRVYRFNGNANIARFRQERLFHSVSAYKDANDALVKEFFAK
jgi:hypothetical protein